MTTTINYPLPSSMCGCNMSYLRYGAIYNRTNLSSNSVAEGVRTTMCVEDFVALVCFPRSIEKLLLSSKLLIQGKFNGNNL